MVEPTRAGFIGVYRRRSPPSRFPWYVRIMLPSGRAANLSSFESDHHAAEAYDRAVLFFGREKSNLNFPKRRLTPTSPAELRRLAHAEFKKRTSSRYRGVRFEPKYSRRPWIATLVGIGSPRGARGET